MVYQFEGKTEKDAIEKAASELGLEKDKFDVEIIEVQKSGFFKKGFVRIEVHIDDGRKQRNERRDRYAGGAGSRADGGGAGSGAVSGSASSGRDFRYDNRQGGGYRAGGGRSGGGNDHRGGGGHSRSGGRDNGYRGGGRRGGYDGGGSRHNAYQGRGGHYENIHEDHPYVPEPQVVTTLPAETDFEFKIIEYVTGLIEKIGCDAKVDVQFREEGKTGFTIASSFSSLIIGKKGKTLDALQIIVNIYGGKIGQPDTHIVLDSENYRLRREEAIVRTAYKVADRVRALRSSLLLEPMNPFERRIVHTTLGGLDDIITHSEGEGMYKQVRVTYRASN